MAVSEGCVQSSAMLEGFRCIFSVAYTNKPKSKLARRCCTAAALDPQEEPVVRSCSTSAGELKRKKEKTWYESVTATI